MIKNKKLKVVHVFWGLGFGGIETMLVNIANEQCSAGADVYVMIINKCYEQTLISALNSKVHLILINRPIGSHFPWFIYKINKHLRQIKPDIVHLHRSELFNYIWDKELRSSTCVTLHDLPKGSLQSISLFRQLISKLTNKPLPVSNVTELYRIPYVYSISNAVQQQLKENYGITSKVICNGILTGKFRQRQGVQVHTPFHTIMVSRLLHEKKGQDLLIEAAAKLKGRISVDFIGDGPSMIYLQNLAKKMNIEDSIRFLGKKPQDYVSTHLADYDLFVQPSRWEGFGLTVAEAMASDVPVLVSEGQGPAEVTSGDMYGWLFKNGDASDLANQISYIITHYSEAVRKASAAQLFVRETYDVSVTARTYLTEYKNIIDKQSHESR